MLLDDILNNKNEILNIFDKYRIKNVKIIGSVSRREENDNSDIDFVADLSGLPNLKSYVELKKELQRYFNRKIDLASIEQIEEHYPIALSKGIILSR